MHKFTEADVKPFTFDDLKGEHVVGQPKFEAFSFQQISNKPYNAQHVTEATIRQERTSAQKNEFKIDDTVRKFRGLSTQEQNDLEKKIQDEVERRIKANYQAAYQEGLEKGKAEGQALAQKALQDAVEVKLADLTAVVDDVHQQSNKIIANNQTEVREFVKRFTKWILIREINEKTYLTDLLEKLILELNARRNLIIKVGRGNFSQMPEVVAAVEAKLGQLVNVRVEIVPEINHPGIILEAENGLIDGSLEGVFANIDKIFEQVIGNE